MYKILKRSPASLSGVVGVSADFSIDCHPEKDATYDNCVARGCQWTPTTVPSFPWCIFPSGHGYELVPKTSPIPTDLGYLVSAERKPGQATLYGNDINTVNVSVEFWQKDVLRIKFFDPANDRYEVPVPITRPTVKAEDTDYEVTINDAPQFGFSVKRISTGTVIVDSTVPGFTFSDQFLEITLLLSSTNVYGFGEHRHLSYAHDINFRTWSMFARDQPPMDEWNLYGVQPFYMNLENDGNANGVLLLNSNAMEVNIQLSPAITYRTTGGILDFYIFLGPTPENVVEQLTSVIGRPLMPPYWGLGFQLCRYGYENTDAVRAVVQRMRDAKIPQDVQWSDIDYMDNARDFSLSTTTFSDLPTLIDDIHNHDQHYVVILDGGIAKNPDDFAYQQGTLDDIFIKYSNGTVLEGHVWPGLAVFPDYSDDKCDAYWETMCRHLYYEENVQFDGLWNDMNEPSNFDVGSVYGCNSNNLNYPPYAPNVLGAFDGKLYDKTICMDTVQKAGSHYDVHSLFGYFMTKRSFNALSSIFPNRRPFIVTRSNYPGSGRYASHWLGDNASNWQAIKDAIIGILEYNIFGMPFAGADICGFLDTTTVELCTRWMQVGAFYPFSRNHNTIGVAEQDPPTLGAQVVAASIQALTERYRLLPYLYTLLQNAHDSGSTVARPLLHEFSKDQNTWNIGKQFLWGSSLLISPVLDEGATEVTAYFPDARWFDYYTGYELSTRASYDNLHAPLDGNITLHVRGGGIIPTQEPGLTTAASRKNPFGLLAALDDSETASGTLYWDDGETPETRQKGIYNEFHFQISANELDIGVVNSGFGDMNPLSSVTIYGLKNVVTSVTVDGVSLDPSQVSFDVNIKVLKLSNLNLSLPVNHTIVYG